MDKSGSGCSLREQGIVPLIHPDKWSSGGSRAPGKSRTFVFPEKANPVETLPKNQDGPQSHGFPPKSRTDPDTHQIQTLS